MKLKIIIPIIGLLFISACGKGAHSTDRYMDSSLEMSEAVPDEVSKETEADPTSETDSENINSENIKKTGELELKYAEQFKVDYYDGGYAHISMFDGTNYIIVPENKEEADFGIKDVTYIHRKPQNIYMAASSATDLILQLGEIKNVKFCSTKASDYYIGEISGLIEGGSIKYVGKYSAPDYEALLGGDCDVAIESTTVYHAPKVLEQLKKLNIPVLIERSSYESSPEGRLEWIKLYGVLLGKETEAAEFFDKQCKEIEAVTETVKNTEPKKVMLFYNSSNGYISVKKPGDYLYKMIKLAGGVYPDKIVETEDDISNSAININWEAFYESAVDADILIYNATMDKSIKSIEDLIDTNELFADFKAVKSGEVYSTGMNIFQESSKAAEVISELNHIINGSDTASLKYIHKLE